MREIKEELLLELKNSWISWRGDLQVVTMMQQAVQAEQEAERGINEEVDAGIRPLMDNLKAKEDLLRRQIELTEAQFDLCRSRFQLLKSSGKLQIVDS